MATGSAKRRATGLRLRVAAVAGMAALAPIAALSIPAPTSTAPTSTVQGVYTAEQASEGAALYAGQCAMCHGKALEGTLENPALTGRFLGNWGHAPLADLFDYIGRAMPQMAPGTLPPASNARIIAYLLQQNGMPAGKTPLPADSAALKTIMLDPAKR
ncbi:c-type cytochrome [Sphingomonas bacterium]|uniref:c-type cytochrome n=1 Tax=Sphingomonas bacterium TaxID=1895847 RepID=UPI001576846D|nr:cytochrome c [Sphingomonas bacterium]